MPAWGIYIIWQAGALIAFRIAYRLAHKVDPRTVSHDESVRWAIGTLFAIAWPLAVVGFILYKWAIMDLPKLSRAERKTRRLAKLNKEIAHFERELRWEKDK
jgi:hypothetical protein